MRAGVDSYSYHRLLGEVRPGESPPPGRWRDGVDAVIAEVEGLGARAVALQTCFVGPPDRASARSLARARDHLEVVLSWGAPTGIGYGADRGALEDLLTWTALAGELGIELVRIVLGGPAHRGAAGVHADRTLAVLEVAASAADERGVQLAVENHGDIAAADLESLLGRLGADHVGVCFDTANALRVGDGVVEAAELLAARVMLVHLKDIEDPRCERDPVAGPCSVPYGEGVVPLAPTREALRRGGFDGLLCIEIGQVGPGDDERALVRSGLAWLADADD